jgi:hypothetical protein
VSRWLSAQEARDHEAADDEEHVDADVAAFESRHARVREYHQDDGDGAQPLNVRSKSLLRRSIARYGTRFYGVETGLVEYGHVFDATSTSLANRVSRDSSCRNP